MPTVHSVIPIRLIYFSKRNRVTDQWYRYKCDTHVYTRCAYFVFRRPFRFSIPCITSRLIFDLVCCNNIPPTHPRSYSTNTRVYQIIFLIEKTVQCKSIRNDLAKKGKCGESPPPLNIANKYINI